MDGKSLRESLVAQATERERLEIKQLSAELARRKMDALTLYEPLETQEEFHKCSARERILLGGNRAGKAQPVDEPVLTPDGWAKIGSLKEGDVVIGGDGKPCTVTGVFPQGVKPVFRVEFNDGTFTRCCEEHLWKVKTRRERFRIENGDWVVMDLRTIRANWGDEPRAIQRIVIPGCVPWMPRRSTPVDPYLLGLLLGDGSISVHASISTADEEILTAVGQAVPNGISVLPVKNKNKKTCDYHLSSGKGGGQNPLMRDLKHIGVHGKRAWEKEVPKDYLFNTAEVRLAVLQGLMDTDGTVARSKDRKSAGVSFSTTSPKLAENVAFLVRSLGGKCSFGKWVRKSFRYRGELRRGRPSVRLHIRMDQCPFRLGRKVSLWNHWKETTDSGYEHRTLWRIQPDGDAECVCISVSCSDHTYVTRDFIVTHNTVASAVEFARACRRRDPHNKYRYPHDDFITFIVGFDQKHIGRKIHTVLLRPGAFNIIRDEKTQEWRAFRPATDEHRKDECKPAPPLIPRREIKEFAWESRAKGIWNCITLHNGTRIYAFPSTGSAPQGDAVDLYWIDEDIAYEDWIEEAQARLPDRGGRLIWSAMPHSRNNALLDLCKRAEEEATRPNPDIVAFNPWFSKNPHISAEEKRKTLKGWAAKGDDVLARRDRGEFAVGDWLVYPNWDPVLHGIEKAELPDGRVPANWTRYMVVDPGRQICAVLFAAVPTPRIHLDRASSDFAALDALYQKHGDDFVLLYDECYLAQCDAAKFASAVKPRHEGYSFHEWIMDEHGGRIREIGSGRSIKDQYRDEVRKLGLSCERFGCDFLPGCDNIDARVEALSGWMTIRADGSTRLKVLKGACPKWNFEIERYRKKVSRDARGVATDKPDTRRNTHLMACGEYLAARNPRYVRPKAKPRFSDNWATLRFQEIQKKQSAANAGQLIVM